MKFAVKKDRFITYLISISLSLGLVLTLIPLLVRPVQDVWLSTLLTAGIITLIGWFLKRVYTHSYYALEADHLVIQFGPIHQEVAYRDITQVKPTRNLLAGLALSLDRVAIYKKGRLNQLISPVDKARFIEALKKRIDSPASVDNS